jgi:hypothetical protein
LTTDQAVKDVRDNLFRIMTSILTTDGFIKAKIVLDRLCMSLALIVIKTYTTCWMDAISNIISFGSGSVD